MSVSQTGESNSVAKLTNEQVIEIYNSKEKGTHLAKKYGVSNATISSIKNGKRWPEITGHKKVDK